MRDLDAATRPWRERPASAVVVCDFDGTLSPIVDDPADARPAPGALEALAVLAGRGTRIGVVSGRPVDFLSERLGPLAGGVLIAGLYGLERSEGGAVRVHPAALAWEPAVSEAAAAARRAVPEGVDVEPKRLAVTIHARRHPEALGWVEGWAAAAAATYGLVCQPGKLSVELRPPLAIDKGDVVREWSASARAVLFAGDDAGDMPAFEALLGLRADGLATLGVLAGSRETPPELRMAADVVVEGPSGVVGILRRVAGVASPRP